MVIVSFCFARLRMIVCPYLTIYGADDAFVDFVIQRDSLGVTTGAKVAEIGAAVTTMRSHRSVSSIFAAASFPGRTPSPIDADDARMIAHTQAPPRRFTLNTASHDFRYIFWLSLW